MRVLSRTELIEINAGENYDGIMNMGESHGRQLVRTIINIGSLLFLRRKL